MLIFLPWAVAGWLLCIGPLRHRHLPQLCPPDRLPIGGAILHLRLAVGGRVSLRLDRSDFFSKAPSLPAVDPVLQALVLTDVVVGAAVTALLLAFALQLYKRQGSLNPDALKPLRQ